MADDLQSQRDEAQLRLALTREASQALAGISSDISKWLYASLLTVNSGGLLALFGVEHFGKPCARIAAAGFYLSGIFFSFLLGYLTVRRAEVAGKLLARQTNVFIKQSVGQHPEPEDVSKWNDLEAELDDSEGWPHLVGWASAVMFLVGSVFRVIEHL